MSALNRKIPFMATVGDLLLVGFAVGCVALLVAFTGEPRSNQTYQGTSSPATHILHTERHAIQN